MNPQGKLFFDLNELPAEDDAELNGAISLQARKTFPSVNIHTSCLFAQAVGPQGIVNDSTFLHSSEASGFQPFSQSETSQHPQISVEQKMEDSSSKVTSTSSSKPITCEQMKAVYLSARDPVHVQVIDREEGEWSDAEDSIGVLPSDSLRQKNEVPPGEVLSEVTARGVSSLAAEDVKEIENGVHTSTGPGQDLISSCLTNTGRQMPPGIPKGDESTNCQLEASLESKQREGKGFEASRALKCANNFDKRKMDERKEAKLGKKRNRQTMFLNLEDVKQAGRAELPTSRKQKFSQPIVSRTVKEASAASPSESSSEKQNQSLNKPKRQTDAALSERGSSVESYERKSTSNCDMQSQKLTRVRRGNGTSDLPAAVPGTPNSRQNSWKPSHLKQPTGNPDTVTHSSVDSRLGSKKLVPLKKANGNGNQYQDTSVERMIREVTSDKLWHNLADTELQSVPGKFESVEEYVRVFEPLLFEECRAQLRNAWEELAEANGFVKVCIKCVEKRERGWYDVTFHLLNESKLAFKEGDAGVLSAIIPESDKEPAFNGRVAGTIRRYIPIDTRDPSGIILHFYVGDLYEPSCKTNGNHILKKLQPKSVWHLAVLGSLATTQREYIALHAFHRLNSQMQQAILKPSPDHFPKYEQQAPALPDCITQNFVDHLHRSFNGPQLAAIQWAAIHTAAGIGSGIMKKQDPWPFTLVQGPPGTGKTHTVWGMLNVIHLVQYQRYYTSFLKTLAPESYKQAKEINSDNVVTGSIEDVLRSMDQNLARSLPKLCLKPRMLVCAPSNAATDELLSRVLDRGFIDGEMKLYRPDVARVGVDSQTHASQAVSVERRADQLLGMSKDEIMGHMRNLREREALLSQQIAWLRRQLNAAAAVLHSQESSVVDPGVRAAREQNRDRLLQDLAAVVESRYKITVEISRLHIVEGKFHVGCDFRLEDARASLEASFADEAEIVFTTVSSSGRKLFSRLANGFDMVVIDEAAQASEVGVLPPLSAGAARCVLVGDPQQLPATVISKAAGTLLYSRSLFERFQQAGCPTILLSLQYRMHPQIRDFPSRYFYQGRLTDSESVSKLSDEIYYKDRLLRPYLFFDVSHGRESHRGVSVSYENIEEARFCAGLYMHLQRTLKSLGGGKVSVGIITPYKLQLRCLKHEFGALLSQEEMKDLYINTVDAFQGQERDVIIMSCVRASKRGVGFVSDVRRMNVALTRARRALWVTGNANALMQSDDWAALIADAKTRNCFMDVDSIPKDFPIPRVSGREPYKRPSNIRGFRSMGPRHR